MRASSGGDIWDDSTRGEAHGRTGTSGRPVGGSLGAPGGLVGSGGVVEVLLR
ncbi:Uncharacterised protein [Collinsella aerofaciens]|uniref:Uncharacterized protein n=1 Tax=Collinsella aerofaciens TaxID=74426 RepID=A0A5K1JC11_9ACTN|nr:Uncharacterised protein [Collinsella aerofaciens]VWM01388.1 Uncharacterised protein [Collinsella aerofaciens]